MNTRFKKQDVFLSTLDHLIFFLIPMMVFNTFGSADYTIQIVPMLMLAASIGRFLSGLKIDIRLPRIAFPVIALLPVVAMNFARTLDGTVFVVAGKLVVAVVMAGYVFGIRHRLRGCLESYYLALVVSVAYATYQYLISLVGLDGHDVGANLPIYLWNELGWHVIETGQNGLFRTPGFAYEPAYFSMFLSAGVLSLIAFPRRNSKLLLLIFLFGLFLSNSRNGQVFIAYLTFGVFFLKRVPMLACRMLPLAVLVLPMALSLIIFAGGGGLDADRSAIARLLPIYIFATAAIGNPDYFLFGVPDYPSFIANQWPSAIMDVLTSEQVNVAPMSLIGFFLYNFGAIGMLLFSLVATYVLRKSKVGLFCFSGYLLVIFNIGSIFWPTTWMMLGIAYYCQRMELSQLFGLPHQRRALAAPEGGDMSAMPIESRIGGDPGNALVPRA